MILIKKILLHQIFRLMFIGSLITLSLGIITFCLDSLPYANEKELTEIPSTLIITPPPDVKGDFIEIAGEIGLAGTDSISCLVLRTENEETYAIVGDKAKGLWKFRYKKVHITGYLHGKLLGIEKSIEVISYQFIQED